MAIRLFPRVRRSTAPTAYDDTELVHSAAAGFWEGFPVNPNLGQMVFQGINHVSNGWKLVTATDKHWVETKLGSETNEWTVQNGRPPFFQLITSAASRGSQLQWGGENGAVMEGFKMATNRDFWLRLRFQATTANDIVLWAGVAITDTSLAATGGPTDGIGFSIADGDASINYNIAKNWNGSTGKTAVDTGWDLSDATETVLGIRMLDGVLTFWNGSTSILAASLANLPDDEDLALSISVEAGNGAARTFAIPEFFAWQRIRAGT